MITQYPFELPRGYVDLGGAEHRSGVMRLATAADEIMPLNDPRVQENPSYLSVIILTRVITSLGTLPRVTNEVIENMFTADIAFLQDMYVRINEAEPRTARAQCPVCGHGFQIPLNFTAGE